MTVEHRKRPDIVHFGNLANTTNTIMMPSNVTDVAGLFATAMSMPKEVR